MNLLCPGERLKHLRKISGMSRFYIEKHYGISESTITKWESKDTGNIGVHNLIRYLDIYKKRGFDITIDNLFSDKEFLLNRYKTDERNNFLDTSFCLNLLKGAVNVFFYADRGGKLLYINPIYREILQLPSLFDPFILKSNTLMLEEVLPNLKKKMWHDIIAGDTVDIEYPITNEGYKLKIRVSPNFCIKQLVVGFIALVLGTSMPID